jgi:hypothetical protein
MAVTASTLLDAIWGLLLNVLNGILELASWASTNQTDIINGIVVIVTLGVIVAFGKTISKFLTGLIDGLLRYLPK